MTLTVQDYRAKLEAEAGYSYNHMNVAFNLYLGRKATPLRMTDELTVSQQEELGKVFDHMDKAQKVWRAIRLGQELERFHFSFFASKKLGHLQRAQVGGWAYMWDCPYRDVVGKVYSMAHFYRPVEATNLEDLYGSAGSSSSDRLPKIVVTAATPNAE